MDEYVTLQSHTHSLTQHNQTNTSISRQVLAPLSFPNQSITPSEELEARLMSFREQLQSHSQNPVRDANPDQLRTPSLNSSLNIFEEIKPDQVHSNHSLLSDEEETDVLLPERSFIMHRSISLCLENSQIHHKKFLMVPQSPNLTLNLSQNVPMSPGLAPGLQNENPVQYTEAELDVVMSPPPTSGPNNGVDINQQLNCTDVPMSPTQPPAPPSSPGTQLMIISFSNINK